MRIHAHIPISNFIRCPLFFKTIHCNITVSDWVVLVHVIIMYLQNVNVCISGLKVAGIYWVLSAFSTILEV
jgi:hypothetical protein